MTAPKRPANSRSAEEPLVSRMFHDHAKRLKVAEDDIEVLKGRCLENNLKGFSVADNLDGLRELTSMAIVGGLILLAVFYGMLLYDACRTSKLERHIQSQRDISERLKEFKDDELSQAASAEIARLRSVVEALTPKGK
jgi:hypothetical protein